MDILESERPQGIIVPGSSNIWKSVNVKGLTDLKENKYEKRDLLIRIGKEEFKRYGYEKASLRQICKKADVTTGAVYFFFKNKADLFDAIVRDVAIELQSIIEDELKVAYNFSGTESGFSIRTECIRYFIEHRDEITIMAFGSEGTKYEGYVKRIEDLITNRLMECIEEITGKKIDRDIAYVIARQRIQCYSVLLDRYSNFEDAIGFLGYIRAYGIGGYNNLLEYINK